MDVGILDASNVVDDRFFDGFDGAVGGVKNSRRGGDGRGHVGGTSDGSGDGSGSGVSGGGGGNVVDAIIVDFMYVIDMAIVEFAAIHMILKTVFGLVRPVACFAHEVCVG